MKEIRGCKKRRQPPVTSRLHCAAHAQLTIFREKNLPSKFCATAREARGSCSSRALDRGSRGGEWGHVVVITKESGQVGRGRDGKRGRPYWVLSLCIVFQRVSTPSSVHPFRFFSFYLRLLSSPSSISSAAFLSPSARRPSYTPRSGYKISRVYAGSDWPGLKPSQITP